MFSGSLRETRLELAHDIREKLQVEVIPGQKLCPTCRVDILSKLRQKEEAVNDETDTTNDEEEDFKNDEIATIEERERLKKTLTDMEFSPIKLHGLPHHSRHIEGRRKLEQVKEKLEEYVSGDYCIDKYTLSEQPIADPVLE